MNVLGRLRDAAILTVAGGALVLEMWTVVPAPTILILAITVLLPEFAPVGAVACAAIVVSSFAFTRGRVRAVAVALSGAACACALAPVVALPFALTAADRELRALGAAAGSESPAFDPVVLVRGYPPTAGVRVERGLPVVSADGAHLALDLYRPLASRFVSHGRRDLRRRMGVRQSCRFGRTRPRVRVARGYTVAAIEYRYAPAHRFPTQLDDVRAALAALAHHATAWNVDRDRVALFGRSAGAELALLAGYEAGPLHVRAVVGYYTPTDLVGGYLRPPFPDPANVRSILRAYLGGTPAERPAAYRDASPLTHVRPGLPPTLLIAGARDELVSLRFQRAMRDALRAHGVPVAAIELPWSNHDFDSIPNGLGGQIARSATERFLTSMLGAAGP